MSRALSPTGLLLCALSLAPAQAQATPATALATPALSTLAPGSADRSAVLNALRGPVGRSLGTSGVVFRVEELRVAGRWAFVRARPQDAGGHPLRPPQAGPEVWALLERRGTAWAVVRQAFPTDVISQTWEAELPQVPRGLWPHRRW